MSNDFTRWFNAQPTSTKWIGVLSLLVPVLVKFGLVGVHRLVFHWSLILKAFQVERPWAGHPNRCSGGGR